MRLAAALALALAALPVGATPTQREVVAPNEPMVVLPAFQYLGASRLSTIEMCSGVVGKTYDNLLTDSDFHNYAVCLSENT